MRYQVDDAGTRRAAGAPLARDRSRCRRAAARSPHPATPTVTEQTWPPDAELIGGRAADRPDPAGRRPDRAERQHRDAPSAPPAATGGWPPTASGRCIPAAADTLVDAVIDGLRPEAGGAGVRPVLRRRTVRRRPGRRRVPGLGRRVRVGRRPSARLGATCAGATVHRRRGRAGRVRRRLPKRADLVVLDPPRTGAGRDVIAAVVASPAAGDRVRRLRSGRPGPRPRARARDLRLRADQHPRLRPVPDDPPPRSASRSSSRMTASRGAP